MKQNEIQVGDTLVYYPPKKQIADNLHCRAVVEGVSKSRVRIRIFSADTPPAGVLRSVSAFRLERQFDLL